MDIKQKFGELSIELWNKYKQDGLVNLDLWNNFFSLFFANDDFIGIESNSRKVFKENLIIPYYIDDNLVISINSLQMSYSSVLNVIIDGLANNSGDLRDKSILVANCSLSGIELLLYSSKLLPSYGKLAVLRFKEGKIPTYFLDLIEKYSSSLLPYELLSKLFSITELQEVFIRELNRDSRVPIQCSRDDILRFIVFLILCSELNQKSEFKQLILDKINGSQFISIKDFFSPIQRIFNNPEIVYCLKKVVGILTELDVTSNLIDLEIILDFLNKFPFSSTEPSFVTQEIAITPNFLSIFEENYSDGTDRKKQGKYYTNFSDADFIVHLAVFRFFSCLNSSAKPDDLFNLIYSDRFSSLALKNNERKFNSPKTAIHILDPSCGSGIFLICITRLFIHLGSTGNFKNTLKLKISGFDLNHYALSVTRLRLIFLELENIIETSFNTSELEKKIPIHLDFNNLVNEDFLLHSSSNRYDLILGNPPFVRQEDIGLINSTKYKKEILTKINEITRDLIKIDKKSDLYVYFCLLGLSLLKNGGILAYLTSNAWLEVKYGLTLQKFLLDKRNRISKFEIMQRSKTRLWSDIGINSIILIGQKAVNDGIIEKDTLFIDSNVNYNQIPKKSLLEGVISRKNHEDEYYRVERIQKDELSETHKWGGTFLRTNEQERTILRKISSTGVFLSSIAEIRFGIKTGSNTFFHLQMEGNVDILKDDSLAFMRNKSDYIGYIEKEYLIPLVKSPAHLKTYIISRDFKPEFWLFYCTSSPEKLKKTNAWRYIQWGEKETVIIKQGHKSGKSTLGFQSLESISKRNPWYSLPHYPIPTLLWTKSYHDKPGCLLNLARAVPDQRFYSIIVFDEKYTPLIFTYLNSSLVWALMESQGNTNMGYGVLDTNVYWLKNLKIPTTALKENEQIKLYMKRLIEEKERVPIISNSKLRKDIDRFYSRYLDLDDYSLECLNKYISKSVKNRID
ncbi:MAG: Eco57I restriction-modification methylase domain-containing protein [Candidatus Hodarchaeales archaeon]